MAETESIDPEKLRDQLLDAFENKQNELKSSKAYYDAERRPDAIGLAVPLDMRKYLAHVGYPRTYVDAIAERQELEGFRIPSANGEEPESGGENDPASELWDWWQANNLDIEATLGHTDALIYGTAYITISMPDPEVDFDVDPEVPLIRVEPPTALYAEVDPRTRKVLYAIRAIYGADGNEIVSATLYLPDTTMTWLRAEGEWEAPTSTPHGLEMVPVIPISNRTRLSDLYGTSEISPELRSVTDAAAQILMNMQGTANLMAIPQRLIFGAKPEELGINAETGQRMFDAYMARILAFEGGEGAHAEQFSAAELRNFVDALDALDRKAASYSGLPPQYLSSSSDNPASAEAIKAAESRLVKKVERKNKIFGGAWEQAMRLAYKMVKGGDIPTEYYRMETVWRDPSTPTYAAKADAAAKLFANGAGLIPRERGWVDMGYTIVEREQMRQWLEQDQKQGLGLIGSLYGASTPEGKPGEAPVGEPPAPEPDAA
ncbi:portal protein [Mycobacterium phage Bxb1]|uniref:Portal protein n=2 Tax=Fromanvirus TaxID=186764 RepID=G8IB51_9CAUD|nr:portal protein [Mycobacterium phage Bxb1]YP_009013468.1 portal protein [Mycobacterium phage Kugel]AAG59716.1 portal protein [Mycobacterium phage Bxb1]AER49945.1 portal protein [Mycobacterium phage Kugel]AXH68034.1 portal protein [Mycobacterium phage Target]